MKSAVALAMLCLSLVGCAEPDPATDRLEAGSIAVAIEYSGSPAELTGSTVQVESDDRPAADRHGPDIRPVRCVLLSGPQAGTIRDLPRPALRLLTPPQ